MTVYIGILPKLLENGLWKILGKIFHVNFLGYAHWFMLIRIYQIEDHSISVDQARYATSIVAKYLDIDTVKVSTKFYNTTLPYDMIFTKDDTSNSDEKVESLTRKSTFITELVLVHLFIYCLHEWN